MFDPAIISPHHTILDHLRRSGINRSYRAGSILFSPGEMAGTLYLVESGTVGLAHAGDPPFQVAHRSSVGSVIASHAVLNQLPHCYTATCLTDVVVCRVSAEAAQYLVRDNAALGAALQPFRSARSQVAS